MLRLFKSGFDFVKKAFLVITVFSLILVLFGSFIKNNRPNINDEDISAAQQNEIYKVIDNKELNSSLPGKITLAAYRLTYCSFLGVLCTDTPPSDDTYFKSSLIGKMSSLIVLPYQHPPASGAYWVTDTLQKAGFIPQSYAAEGIGFSSIKPLMNLWTIFRDVAYLLIVLVLVAIGFMIMFRMKLNPQTVISVENSLPKIVVALLLITFSFAIAGFLIDLTYLLILISISILSSGNKFYDAAKVQNEFLNSNLGTLWDYILPQMGNANQGAGPLDRIFFLGDALASIVPNVLNQIVQFIGGALIPILFFRAASQPIDSTGIKSLLNGIDIFGNGVGMAPGAFFGTAFTLVIYSALVAIAWNGIGFVLGIIVLLTLTGMLFNIFFILFKSYIQIIISIIFSPLILLFEAVPGKSTFTYWLKSLLGELITFPIVITMLLIGKIMMATLTYPGDYWKAPFVGNLNTQGFGVILGAGLIFIIPDIIKFVKEAIGVKPLPFNIGVGTFLGGAGTVGGGSMGILQQFSTISMGLNGVKSLTGLGGGGTPSINPNKDSAAESKKKAQEYLKIAREVANLKSGEAPA